MLNHLKAIFLLMIFVIPGVLAAPGISYAGFDPVETDARTVPWPTVRRLALEAGEFPPAYRPVTEGELAALLNKGMDQAMTGQSEAFTDENEFGRLEFWLDRYRRGGGGQTWYGCDCKVNPPQVRLTGRMLTGFTDLGSTLSQEAGLAWSPGWNATFEPILDFSAGPWWLAVSGRLSGQVASAGVDYAGPGGDTAPLTWPEWDIATGRSQVRGARLQGGKWQLDAPRLMGGVTWGNWGLSVGWQPRSTGPGLTGVISVDQTGPSFPAFTARRHKPFDWGAPFWNFLAPEDLLFSAGLLSEQLISYEDEEDVYHEKYDEPWFFQWLVSWEFTSWFRTTLTHTALAVPREGSLWGDILQINFPIKGTTWSETTHGPITDRVFSAQFVGRWRHAPWPLLPSSAGRLFWDYAGTDFLPSGPDGIVPQISIPASVIGIELVDPGWDLAFEYAELVHEDVLWYTNSGFSEGYSHDGWLLGHELGGSGESFTGLVNVRPSAWSLETGLKIRWATWGMKGETPGDGSQTTVAVSVRNLPMGARGGPTGEVPPASPLLWEITAEWNEEEALPYWDAGESRSWWRVYCRLGI